MTIYISSSFAMNMLEGTDLGVPLMVVSRAETEVEKIILNAMERGVKVISAIRNKEIAKILTDKSENLEYRFSISNFKMQTGDVLFYANYIGRRIPTKATELPPNGRIDWHQITVL